MISFFLYIDPGTGSMLFSILVGAAATLFFLGKAAWLKLKVFFSGKKQGTFVDSSYKKYVIYCEDKRYWSLFKLILDEFEKRQIEVTYFVSTKDDPVFSENYSFVKSEVVGEGNAAFAKLNMISAGFVLMTTPGLQVYQLKRSKNVKHYSHIVHAPVDATMYRLFGIDYFDSILLTGDVFKEDIVELEKQRHLPAKELVTVGCPYLDYNFVELSKKNIDKTEKFTVLVSPSWGPSALLSRFGEKLLDPLVSSDFDIIIRPHPQSKISEADILEKLQNKYASKKNVFWDFQSDNTCSMIRSDIMISDFSGIIFDYTFLFNKPVFYVAADMDLRLYDAFDLDKKNYGKEIWEFEKLRSFAIELKEETFSDIVNEIKQISTDEELCMQREIARNEGWMYQGEAASRVVDYMIKTVD